MDPVTQIWINTAALLLVSIALLMNMRTFFRESRQPSARLQEHEAILAELVQASRAIADTLRVLSERLR